MNSNKHIILIGFKNVGKTIIGKELAIKLQKTFIDLDQKIEVLYENLFQYKRNCRQIVAEHGLHYFRKLEHKVLNQIINLQPSVISLCGGSSRRSLTTPTSHTTVRAMSHTAVLTKS